MGSQWTHHINPLRKKECLIDHSYIETPNPTHHIVDVLHERTATSHAKFKLEDVGGSHLHRVGHHVTKVGIRVRIVEAAGKKCMEGFCT